MPRVFVPVELRPLTNGEAIVDVTGATVKEVVVSLEERFPGISQQLVRDGQLRADISVAVDSRIVSRGLREAVGPDSEIQFLPSISGG